MKNNGLKAFFIIVLFVIVAGAGIYFAKTKADNNKKAESEKTVEDTNQNVTPDDGTTGEVAGTTSDQQKQTDIIFYYGSTCPHCKKVEEFIAANKIDKLLKFETKEVYGSKQNAEDMMQKQTLCKDLKDEDKGGVPFLYSSEKCVVGDQPIIDYLKEQVGM